MLCNTKDDLTRSLKWTKVNGIRKERHVTICQLFQSAQNVSTTRHTIAKSSFCHSQMPRLIIRLLVTLLA